MNRQALGVAGITAAVVALGVTGRQVKEKPLWPGARYSAADRDHALRKGLRFLYSVARQPDVFRTWGHDLLSAFATVATTSGDRGISELAGRMGHERAIEWRRRNRAIPADASADEVANLVFGSDAAETLGVPDGRFRERLRQAAARFHRADFLGFDPAGEGPPPRNRYAVFQDALIAAYTGEHYGVPLGVRYAEVLRWLPAMHPYPPRSAGEGAYFDTVYTVTHIVYTNNGYNQSRLSPACFPEEFAYLAANLPQAIDDRDPETLGEYLDSLQSFGLTLADPRIQRGVEFLLATQNPDGSWGDPRETDAYARYHTAWTALNGIQTFRWTRVLPCPAR